MSPPRRRIEPAAFSVRASLAFAEAALARPPAHPSVERPVLRGELVARFVLPLRLCPPTNRTRGRASWAQAQTKAEAWKMLLAQARFRVREEPLPGRPQVICVRFSPVESDPNSDWAKIPIDLLCIPKGRQKHGLGFLPGDKWSEAETRQRWEPAPRGQGCCYFEVRSG